MAELTAWSVACPASAPYLHQEENQRRRLAGEKVRNKEDLGENYYAVQRRHAAGEFQWKDYTHASSANFTQRNN